MCIEINLWNEKTFSVGRVETRRLAHLGKIDTWIHTFMKFWRLIIVIPLFLSDSMWLCTGIHNLIANARATTKTNSRSQEISPSPKKCKILLCIPKLITNVTATSFYHLFIFLSWRWELMRQIGFYSLVPLVFYVPLNNLFTPFIRFLLLLLLLFYHLPPQATSSLVP